MIDPKVEDIGRTVVYIGNRYPGGKREFGVITSLSEHYVFVHYTSDTFSKATLRDDLEWSGP